MEKLVVLENMLEGLFILPAHKKHWFDKNTNIPVTREDIISEFIEAKFIGLNSYMERAETKNFIFFKYEEDKEDDIIWVQEK